MKKIPTLAGIVILLIAARAPLAQVDDPNADLNFIYTQSAMTIKALSTQFASTLNGSDPNGGAGVDPDRSFHTNIYPAFARGGSQYAKRGALLGGYAVNFKINAAFFEPAESLEAQ